MNIKLTNDQVLQIVKDTLFSGIENQNDQIKYARMVFDRREHLDPIITLHFVIRQIMRQHSLSYAQVIEAVGEVK